MQFLPKTERGQKETDLVDRHLYLGLMEIIYNNVSLAVRYQKQNAKLSPN